MYDELHPLLRRAMLFLESENWASAAEYCERALDLEPENAYAYLIKLMSDLNLSKEEDLGKVKGSYRNWSSFKNAYRFGDEELRARLDGYLSEIEESFRIQNELRIAKEKEEKLKAELAEKEALYQDAVRYGNDEENISSLNKAIKLFQSFPDYKDSKLKLLQCEENLIFANQLREQRIQKMHSAEKRKKCITVIVVALILIAIIIGSYVWVTTTTESNEKRVEVITQKLIGRSFSGKDSDYISENYGGPLTTVSEMTERDLTCRFESSGDLKISVTERYDKEPFLTKNGVRQWDSKTSYTKHSTWGNVSVSLTGEVTITVDGKTCKVKVDSNDRPTSVVIDGVTYK